MNTYNMECNYCNKKTTIENPAVVFKCFHF